MSDFALEFTPLLPWAAVLLAATMALLLTGVALWRRRRGALLRGLALGFLVLALAGPQLRREQRETLASIAVIVVDDSASAKLAGRGERIEALRAQLATSLARLPGIETRMVRTATADGPEETRAIAALTRALEDIPRERLAGAFIIGDGQVHDVPADPAALALGAPVHGLLAGKPGERDNRIEVIAAPRFGLVGSEATAEIRVTGSGAAAGERATIRVRREGAEPEPMEVPFDTPVALPFSFTRPGKTLLEIELDGAPGELTLVNNRAIIEAEGIRENLRVLLVSGEPHAGERTWRNLLRSDAAVDLVHFTILRPPEKQDGTPINQLSLIAFPTRELFSEKLEDFDLIIFDRYQRRGVLPLIYLDNVARYVEGGGAVLVAAGADFAAPTQSLAQTPLASILPVRPTRTLSETPFRPHVTEAGRRHPVTAGLPGAGVAGSEPSWGRWLRLVDAEATSGETVMTGPDDKPLLVLDRRGTGRVALLLSDHAWLWARGYDGGGPHADLLRRLSHWLMKEPDLEEEALRLSPERRALTIERRTMAEDPGAATLIDPAGERREVALARGEDGVFRARVPAETPGVWRAEMSEMSAVALIGEANAREYARVETSDAPLKPLAEATGGAVRYLGGAAGSAADALPRLAALRDAQRYAGEGWLAVRDRDAHLVTGVAYTPLIEGWAALLAALALLGLAWWREGR